MENDLFEKALMFAVAAHRGMYRKAQKIPYILHPMEVASIAASMTTDQEVMAAALLHDTVEDTSVTAEEILENFGERVAALVRSETENKHREIPAEDSWMVRKMESLQDLREAEDPGVKILWLSDKLSNMRSFSRLKKRLGEEFWQDFHQNDPLMQQWYYREIGKLTEDLKDTAAWEEYSYLLDVVFGKEEEKE